MDRQVIVITAGTFAVPSILMMGWIHVLNGSESWSRLRTTAILLAGGAGLLFLSRSIDVAEMIALAVPLYHLALYRISYKVFLRQVGREPLDVSFNWARGLFVDRVFALGFCFAGIGSAFAVIVPLIFGTAVEPA